MDMMVASQVCVGPFKIELRNEKLFCNGKNIKLSKIYRSIIKYLYERAGEDVSITTLKNIFWQKHPNGDELARAHMYRLEMLMMKAGICINRKRGVRSISLEDASRLEMKECARRIWYSAKLLSLSTVEMDLLWSLLMRPNSYVPESWLHAEVWSHSIVSPESRRLSTAIYYLRQKLLHIPEIKIIQRRWQVKVEKGYGIFL